MRNRQRALLLLCIVGRGFTPSAVTYVPSARCPVISRAKQRDWAAAPAWWLALQPVLVAPAHATDGAEVQPALPDLISRGLGVEQLVVGGFLAVAVLVALSILDSFKQPEVAWRAGPFRYVVNRGTLNFHEAFLQLAEEKRGAGKPDEVFTYFDTFEGEELPDLHEYKRVASLIGRDVTDPFDDKLALAEMLRESGGAPGAFPPSFRSSEEALRATEGDDSTIFYVKVAGQTGGHGMQVVGRDGLAAAVQSAKGRGAGSSAVEAEAEAEAEERVLIQQAVQDVELMAGRKFVVRYHALVHDGRIYLHRRGIVVQHGLPYERDSVDYRVQIQHDWMQFDPERSARLHVLHLLPGADRWLAGIAKSLRQLKPAVLGPLLAASSRDRYCVIGGDALIEAGGEARLIEFNMYPNLWVGEESIDSLTTAPLLRDVAAKVMLGAPTPEFEEL